MKLVTVKNKSGKVISENNVLEDPTDFLDFNIKNNSFGKPMRWVREKVTSQDEHGDAIYIYPDEQYEDADVIDTEERPVGPDSELTENWVRLKPEYTIEIEDYVAPVPASISPAQARKALTWAGIRDAVESAIAASDDQDLKDDWEFATAIERTNPGLLAMADGLNISSEQLDALFRYGATR